MGEAMIEVVGNNIRDHIFSVRGKQVMLDADLANLYRVQTKAFNQAIKRNIERFPEDFRFLLSKDEFGSLRSQVVTSKKRGGRTYLPYVFTEQGVAMLASVLKGEAAVQMSIRIINEFVALRQVIKRNSYLVERIDNVERKQLIHEVDTASKFDQLFNALAQIDDIPSQKIFFEGQVFDAHIFVSKIIRKAKKKIVLIDNFVDESVLTLLTKRRKGVAVTIYTRNISNSLAQDIAKYNAQYPNIELTVLKVAHDRFLIVDGNAIYHFGASLKDLGKKWFACSLLDKSALKMLRRLEILNSIA